MIKICLKTLILLAMLGAVATPLVVQANDGSATIRGTVRLADKALEKGSKITAINIDNGYRASIQSGEDGNYTITGLQPGRYKISIENAEPIDDTITLLVGQTAEFNISGRAASADEAEEKLVEEVLYVYGTASKRITASQAATVITPEQIQRLPKVDRNFLNDANLAPGVTVESNPDGSVTFRGGAQQANRINVFIDGVSQKDNVLRSGISGQDSSRGNPFPQSAIDQYRVITSNYKAEYEHLSGAAITAVTKSGTNELHGGFFYDYTDAGLREKTPLEKEAGEKADSQQEQYGGWIAGPIIKDTLHYFFTYERKNNEDLREISVPPTFSHLIDNYPQFLQDAINANTGATTANFEEDLYFVKFDWKINDSQKLDLSVKYRDEVEVTNLGGFNTYEYATDKLNEDTRVALSHEFNKNIFTNVLILTYEDTGFSPSPRRFEPGLQFKVGGTDGLADDIINLGGGADFQFKGQEGWSIKDDITFSNFSWFGDHVVKTGFLYKEIELTAIEQNSLNPQFFFALDSVGIPTDDTTTRLEAVPYKVEFGRLPPGGSAAAVSKNKQIGFYIQDDWRPTPRLELNIGIRYDYEASPQYKDFVTNPVAVEAIRNYSNLDNADYDINDYISTGAERDNFDEAWAPRFGFSYDISEGGEYVLFGGYGRSYDRIRYDYIQLEATKESFPRRTVYFEGPHRQDCNEPCIEWQPSYLSQDVGGLDSQAGVVELFLLDNDLKTPYSDQFSLGLNAFIGDWETEIAYKHIVSKDGFYWTIGNRREDGTFFPPGGTFNWPSTFPLGSGYSQILLGRNGLESELDSVNFKATKPHQDSNWGATFVYTWSDAIENREFGEVFALDYPTLDGYGFNKSGGVSEHSIVSTLTYDLPWGIQFAGKLILRSAAPFYGLNCTLGDNDCFYQQGYLEEETFILGKWAYRQVDMAFSKNFSIQDYGGFYVRADILNVTDEVNYSDVPNGPFRGVDSIFGVPGMPNPNVGEPTGRLAGPTRTVKLSLGYNF